MEKKKIIKWGTNQKLHLGFYAYRVENYKKIILIYSKDCGEDSYELVLKMMTKLFNIKMK